MACAGGGIGGQRAFHKVGHAFLLEALEGIVDRFEDYWVERDRWFFDFDGGAQAGSYPLQDLVATWIINLRFVS